MNVDRTQWLSDFIKRHDKSTAGTPEWILESRDAGPLAAVCDAWAAIVGTDIAARSRPVEIAHGALLVVTCSSAWSQHLGFMSERIVAAVNEAIGRPGVERVRFRVGPLHIPRPQIEMAKPGNAPALRGPGL